MINPVTGRRASLIGEAPTKNPDAYDAFLRGVSLFQRFTYSEFPPARDQFLRAVELDPQFALAHAWLAASYDQLARSALGNTVENRTLAAASLDRAIKIDPRIADLWWVQMWLGKADSASLTLRINNFERALKDSPENALLMGELATAYMRVGRRAQALDLWERARNIDPLWVPAIDAFAFTTYLYRGDRQRAVELIEEMEGLATDDPRPAELRALMAFSEGRALDWDHWKMKAIELAPRDPPLHGYLSLDYGHLGIMDAARYHARISQQLVPDSGGGAYNFAHIDLFAGNVDAARAVVQRAMKEAPDDLKVQHAQVELQYFIGNCDAISSSRTPARCWRWPSPGSGLPARTCPPRMACASGFSTCCWMARFSGRAPYTGS